MTRIADRQFASSSLLIIAAATAPLLWLSAWGAPASAKPPPPARRTYLTLHLGLENPAGVDAGCLRFTNRRICLESGDYPTICGRWTADDDRGTRDPSGFSFEIDWNASGTALSLAGEARVEASGRGSSLGGAARVAAEELEIETNVSFAGTEMKRRRCRRLMRQFASLTWEWTATLCLERARFGDPSSSPYVLPYPVGDAFLLGQSYCNPVGSHRSGFAYDFMMPVGTPVVAVRDGVAWIVADQFADGDRQDEHSNDLWIEHPDGSVSNYAHLQHGSFLVQPGDLVTAGQTVAASGDTGIGPSEPHLHFEVFSSRDVSQENSLPVNFRNADGPLDERGGLRWGETYEALPW